MNEPITHILLDIEGTTCPVSFVSGTLFPYAARELGPYLECHRDDAQVRSLVDAVIESWQQDPDPQAQQLLNIAREQASQRQAKELTERSVMTSHYRALGDSKKVHPFEKLANPL